MKDIRYFIEAVGETIREHWIATAVILSVVGMIVGLISYQMNLHYRADAVTIETVISNKQYYPAHWDTRWKDVEICKTTTVNGKPKKVCKTKSESYQVWVPDQWAVWWAEMPCRETVSQYVDKAFYDSVKVGDEVAYKTHWVKCVKTPTAE